MKTRLFLAVLFLSATATAGTTNVECYNDPKGHLESTLLTRARMAQVECVREILASKTPINVDARDDENKNLLNIVSELRGADMQKGYEIAEMALAKGIAIDNKDFRGNTPLCNATYERPDLARLLIENGANVNVTCRSGKTPIEYATHIETLHLLITKGADVNANDGAPIRQQVSWAIVDNELHSSRNFDEETYQEYLAMIKLLLDNGAKIEHALQEVMFFSKSMGVPLESLKTYQFLMDYKEAAEK